MLRRIFPLPRRSHALLVSATVTAGQLETEAASRILTSAMPGHWQMQKVLGHLSSAAASRASM